MEVKRITDSQALSLVKSYIDQQQEGILYLLPTKTLVWAGNGIEPNYDYATENNIEIIKLPNEGNTIVTGNGNVDIAIFTKDWSANTLADKIMNTLVFFLKNQGLNAKYEANDLLIDNYKCGSWGSRRYDNILFVGLHFSLNVDMEIIKNICNKEMNKIPKGLNDYGVTIDNILTILNLTLDSNMEKFLESHKKLIPTSTATTIEEAEAERVTYEEELRREIEEPGTDEEVITPSVVTTTLDAPTNFRFGTDENDVYTLYWDFVANADGYNLYINSQLTTSGISTIYLDLSTMMREAEPGTYTFNVTATGTGYTESAFSDTLSVTLED